MSGFVHVCPPRTVFRWGALQELPAEAAALGNRPLVVCGRSLRARGVLGPLLEALSRSGLDPLTHEGVPAEPGLADLDRCIEAARTADSVIAIGGGSVLDIAKGAAALAPPPGAPDVTAAEFFSGRSVPDTGRPILAVPTTSGTGSEVTWVTVLVDSRNRRKASIRGSGMMPRVALLDPELTVTCSPTVTAQSGMDAFVQAVEAYTSVGANAWTDALALQAAVLTAGSLETAVREPGHREAREAMALGSMLAGTALNTSRLGLVHGLAHPIGAVTGAAHGLLCGLLMPAVMRFNRMHAMQRYARLAVAIGLADPKAPAEVGSDALEDFVVRMLQRLKIPTTLSEIGLEPTDFDWIARETMPSGSTKANPRPVSLEDARSVTESCWSAP